MRRWTPVSLCLAIVAAPAAWPQPTPPPPPLDQMPPTREALAEWLATRPDDGEASASLLLNDGSQIRGRPRIPPGCPLLSLRVAFSPQPLEIGLEHVARIEFRPPAALPHHPPAVVRLRDGGWILGAQLLGLDEAWLQVTTLYAGEVRLPRGAVASIDLVAGEPAAPGGGREGIILEADGQQIRLPRGELRLRLAPPPPPPFGEHETGLRMEPTVPVRVIGRAAAGEVKETLAADERTVLLDADRLVQTDGPVLEGRALRLAGDGFLFAPAQGAPVRIPIAAIRQLLFRPQAWTPMIPAPGQLGVRAALITGEVWAGVLHRLDDEALHLGWFDGQTVRLPRALLHALGDFERGIAGLRQWPTSARASSEYSSPRWSAMQATGPPDTLRDGDLPTAWATREPDGGHEWLELTYAVPVRATRIRVRETCNPGAVARIEGVDLNGATLVLWEGEDPTRQSPGWLEAAFDPTPTLLQTLRIHLDTSRVEGWNEIDTVELIGEAEGKGG